MKIWRWKTGSRWAGLALAVCVLWGTAGCSFLPHRELTAPCSDYKAASFTPAAGAAASIPCDTPQPMVRPPWIAALDRPTAHPVGG